MQRDIKKSAGMADWLNEPRWSRNLQGKNTGILGVVIDDLTYVADKEQQ